MMGGNGYQSSRGGVPTTAAVPRRKPRVRVVLPMQISARPRQEQQIPIPESVVKVNSSVDELKDPQPTAALAPAPQEQQIVESPVKMNPPDEPRDPVQTSISTAAVHRRKPRIRVVLPMQTFVRPRQEQQIPITESAIKVNSSIDELKDPQLTASMAPAPQEQQIVESPVKANPPDEPKDPVQTSISSLHEQPMPIPEETLVKVCSPVELKDPKRSPKQTPAPDISAHQTEVKMSTPGDPKDLFQTPKAAPDGQQVLMPEVVVGTNGPYEFKDPQPPVVQEAEIHEDQVDTNLPDKPKEPLSPPDSTDSKNAALYLAAVPSSSFNEPIEPSVKHTFYPPTVLPELEPPAEPKDPVKTPISTAAVPRRKPRVRVVLPMQTSARPRREQQIPITELVIKVNLSADELKDPQPTAALAPAPQEHQIVESPVKVNPPDEPKDPLQTPMVAAEGQQVLISEAVGRTNEPGEFKDTQPSVVQEVETPEDQVDTNLPDKPKEPLSPPDSTDSKNTARNLAAVPSPSFNEHPIEPSVKYTFYPPIVLKRKPPADLIDVYRCEQLGVL